MSCSWMKSTTLQNWRGPATAVVLGLGLVACTSPTTTDLQPAPTAEQPPGQPEAAVDRVNGVRAVVQSSDWPSDEAVTDQLTPVHVLIENYGDTPVRIRYREFALIGPQGQYYAALPPMAAKADVQESVSSVERYSPVANPSFRHQGFFVAPAYHYGYRSIPVWTQDFHHDPSYHQTYYTRYEELDISVEELRSWALPEGVIEAGGSVSGYLYFEQLDPDLPSVQFRADVVNAENGRTLGALSIPFEVEED